MKINRKEYFIEELKRVPIVQYVCAKLGVARATFYRWQIDDKKFFRDVKKAIQIGDEKMNDFCESKLIKKIREENMQAIIFWLKHHKGKYKTKNYFIINNKNEIK